MMSRQSNRSQDGGGRSRTFSLSPPPRRLRHHGGERNIIERVSERSSVNIVFLTLTWTYYTEWSLVMKVNLQAVGLWDIIDSGVGEYHEDRSTLATLLWAMPAEMQAGLAIKATAHNAWEVIKKVRLDTDRVREANAERLRREFNDIEFKVGETVEDFSLRLNTIASQLWVLGEVVPNKEVIKRMLHAIPDKLEQVAISMETLLDLDSLSIEEAVGHLCVVKQRKRPSQAKESSGRLLLTEVEWMARMKARDDGGSGGKPGTKNKGGKPTTGGGWKGEASREDVCGYCGKKGHKAWECHKKKCDEEAHAHLAQGEEEQSLLMAHFVILCSRPLPKITSTASLGLAPTASANFTPTPSPKFMPSASPPAAPPTSSHRGIHISEQWVFADLGSREQHDHDKWVLDSSAMNHMTGCKELFAKLNMHIYDTVKFGDGSITAIEGRDTIILTCKTGEHRALTDVYFIPRLKASTISLGQLDETGCRIDIIGGILCIFDQDSQLLAKVHREESCLYYLNLKVGHLVCLAAHSSEVAWKWHACFGHQNFSSLRKLATQNMMHRLLMVDQVDQVCDGCLVGKQRRAPFSTQARHCVSSILNLVHGDLCGPVTPVTPDEKRYFLLLVDDMSRYMWLHLIASKDQAPAEIINFKVTIEVETEKKLKVLQTDRGGEFTSVEFRQYCTERGVHHQFTTLYCPQ
jgi:hypothetical protein